MSYTCAVITVSDKGYAGEREDTSGPAVCALAEENGFSVKGLDFSPIRGPEGNVEFLLWLNKAEKKEASFDSASIDAVVDAAHKNFKMD